VQFYRCRHIERKNDNEGGNPKAKVEVERSDISARRVSEFPNIIQRIIKEIASV
jgi:hypothetical protein